MDREIIVIADDIRSSHNVGSLLRTCEGLGINKVYLTGYTPYPKLKNDQRLPHIANKITKRILKTSLGAEKMVDWAFCESLPELIKDLKSQGYEIVAVELEKSAIELNKFKTPKKVAFIFGNERIGIDKKYLKLADQTVFIPMLGKKESFNVVQSAAMVLYVTRYN
jgi:tRNA G18 (ribose-2'-O)-methylase SpoU